MKQKRISISKTNDNILLQNIALISLMRMDSSFEKNDEKLDKLLKQKFNSPNFIKSEVKLQEAILMFREKDKEGLVSQVFDSLEKMKTSKNKKDLLVKISSQEFFDSLIELSNEVFQEDRLSEAKNMFALISILFPQESKPLILMAIAEWEEKGIEAGVIFYEKLIKERNDPLLMFCAAECFNLAKKRTKALDTLQFAADVLAKNSTYSDYEIELANSIEKFALKISN